jgi:hypothetical protein
MPGVITLYEEIVFRLVMIWTKSMDHQVVSRYFPATLAVVSWPLLQIWDGLSLKAMLSHVCEKVISMDVSRS